MHYDFLEPQELTSLAAMPLEARFSMAGNVAGRHRSVHKGSSIEFSQYRKYVQGDDTRRLDWKVYARSDRHYIKEFEADTNLRAYLVVDTSGSMGYTSHALNRFEYARYLAASLAYLAMNQGDAVGLSIVNQKGGIDIPALRKKSHLHAILEALSQVEPAGETVLIEHLHHLADKVSSRALVLIFSDFFVSSVALGKALGHLRYAKHDIGLFHLLDPQEMDFSFQRPYRFEDMESGERVAASPKEMAGVYHTHLQKFLREMREQAHHVQADYCLANTTTSYVKILQTFLAGRLKQRK